jgi:hypothetical protein
VCCRSCVGALRQERLRAGASTNAPQVAWFVLLVAWESLPAFEEVD